MTGGDEVLVVGGGPAGSATALLLARAGVQVRVLERARFPRRKVCGEYLNAGAVAALERLGLLDAVRSVGSPLRGVRLVVAAAQPVALPFPRPALSCARELLDALLLDAAAAAGAAVERARVEESRGVADQQGAGRRCAAHVVRERPNRDARAEARRPGERARPTRERGRRCADAGVQIGRPARQPRPRDDDHHVGRRRIERIEREVRAVADVHLDAPLERTEAGVVSADRIPRAAPQRSRQAEPPRDDRAGTVGPDDDARAPFAQPTVFVTDLQADAAPA